MLSFIKIKNHSSDIHMLRLHTERITDRSPGPGLRGSGLKVHMLFAYDCKGRKMQVRMMKVTWARSLYRLSASLCGEPD